MPFDKKAYMKEYRQTPKFKKYNKIKNWKNQGLIGDYEDIYNKFINTTNCDLCNIELCEGLKGSNKKCMDHDHNTGLFRNIVCTKCNSNRSDKKKRNDNISGYKNVFYNKKNKGWIYQKKLKDKNISKWSKNKIDILCFKFAGIILYKY